MTESVERMSAILSECEDLAEATDVCINVSSPESMEIGKEKKNSEGPDADMDIQFLQTLLNQSRSRPF